MPFCISRFSRWQPFCSYADAAATLSPNVPPPNLQSKHPALPCLNLNERAGFPSTHQMPKGTCPNNHICCHASVRVGERGAHGPALSWGGGGGGGPEQSPAPESAIVGTAQARGREGKGVEQQTQDGF